MRLHLPTRRGLLAAGSVIGGYVGARIGRRLPGAVLRVAVVVVGVTAALLLLLGGFWYGVDEDSPLVQWKVVVLVVGQGDEGLVDLGGELLPHRGAQPGGDDVGSDLDVERLLVVGVDDGAADAAGH